MERDDEDENPQTKRVKKSKNGETAMVCDICQKEFGTKGSLKTHRRVHTGERPFVCPITSCSKRFSQQANCSRHVRLVHTNNGGNGRTKRVNSEDNEESAEESNQSDGVAHKKPSIAQVTKNTTADQYVNKPPNLMNSGLYHLVDAVSNIPAISNQQSGVGSPSRTHIPQPQTVAPPILTFMSPQQRPPNQNPQMYLHPYHPPTQPTTWGSPSRGFFRHPAIAGSQPPTLQPFPMAAYYPPQYSGYPQQFSSPPFGAQQTYHSTTDGFQKQYQFQQQITPLNLNSSNISDTQSMTTKSINPVEMSAIPYTNMDKTDNAPLSCLTKRCQEMLEENLKVA